MSPSILLRTLSALLLITSCSLPDPGTTQYLAGASDAGLAPTVMRAEAAGNDTIYTDQQSWNLPRTGVTLNDAALLLAGLPPIEPRDPYSTVRRTAAWQMHARELDKLWQDYEWRHRQPIHQWAAQEIPDLHRTSSLFYPFSGPDFLFANAFFPTADTVVMCGLESAEALPTIADLSPAEVADGLQTLRTAISSVMQFSFFITKDMRNDLNASRFKGVLPIMLVFMARTGHGVESVDAIRIDATGSPVITHVTAGNAPGLLIRCRSPQGTLTRVFYVRQNLADDSLTPGGPFLSFVSQAAPGVAFTKSASYLMHEASFSTIRNYLTTQRSALVQCPSGVPYRFLNASSIDLRLYGNYQRTLGLFGDACQQPDLAEAYRIGLHRAQPLPFGIGYLYQPSATCLMVARMR